MADDIEKVTHADRQMRAAMDEIPLLVSFVDADQRYQFANRAYEDWFGIPSKDLVGRKVREVIGEGAWTKLGPFVLRGLAGERFSFEQRGVPYRHGGTKDVRVSFVPRFGKDGKVEGYTALLEDITAQVRVEAERDWLVHQKAQILESMSDAFYALDSAWRVTLVNRSFERLLKRTPEEVMGKVLWDAFPNSASPEATIRKELTRCMTDRVSVRFTEKSPTIGIWLDVHAYPTPDGGIAVFFSDVSVRQEAKEVQARQTEFEQYLIGIVSHDLRQPISAISMSAANALRRPDLDEKMQKSLSRVSVSAGRADRLIRDLLDFTKARTGEGLPTTLAPVDLFAVIAAVIDEVQTANPERLIHFSKTGQGQGNWDADRISQVVGNLLNNAIAYGDMAAPVTVRVAGHESSVFLEVHNKGPAIAPEMLPQLFHPMKRGTGLRQETRSVGLGLFIVQKIVEAHRGTVAVHSSDADGTTVTVTLPR